MNDHDALLNQLAARPVPAVPGNLRHDVWRAIRLRREQMPHPSLLDQLAQWLWREQVTASALALALMIGVGFAALSPPALAESEAASRALGLRVFSESAPTLRLTALP